MCGQFKGFNWVVKDSKQGSVNGSDSHKFPPPQSSTKCKCNGEVEKAGAEASVTHVSAPEHAHTCTLLLRWGWFVWPGGEGDVGLLWSQEALAAPQGSRSLRIPGSRVTAPPSAPRRAPARRQPPSWLRRPFHFRVGVGVCPGRGGARGGTGARGARRAEMGGGLAPSPFLGSLRGAGGGGFWAAVTAKGPVAAAAPRRSPHTPPRADTRSFLGTPPRWGWGRGAASGRPRGERSRLAGWAARRQEKKLFPPAPRAWSLARVYPSGWELHLRPGREVRAGLWGTGGRGVGWRALGFRLPSASLPPGARVGGRPSAPPAPVSRKPVSGCFAASSRWWGCDPRRGLRRRGLPLKPPPQHTLAHTHLHAP